MRQVERHAFTISDSFVGAKPREDGAYVLYGDYAALQQKLDAANKRADACMNAEMVWEKAMMEAIGEDGPSCVSKAIAALKAERDAALAENAALKNYIGTECFIMEQDAHPMAEADICATERMPETPVTDAYLNAVRAEGLDMAAAEIDRWVGCGSLAREIRQKSIHIRAGNAGKDGV